MTWSLPSTPIDQSFALLTCPVPFWRWKRGRQVTDFRLYPAGTLVLIPAMPKNWYRQSYAQRYHLHLRYAVCILNDRGWKNPWVRMEQVRVGHPLELLASQAL